MLRVYICVTLGIFLVGCASPANLGNTGVREVGPTVEQIPESPIASRANGEQPEIDAVKYLLDGAERALKIEDYSRAQALADRALRIERTAARAYLVSAMVQVGYGNLLKADSLARQGLLYTTEDSTAGLLLRKFLSGKQDDFDELDKEVRGSAL